MKNVQYYLNTLNLKELVNTYFYRIKDSLLENTDNDASIKELELRAKFEIIKYIKKLQNLSVKELDNQGILLAYEGFMFETTTEPVFSMIYKKDLIENKETLDKVESYAYELTPNEEIMGFLVSDSEYTQKHIYELIADVLYEASFFGYEETEKLQIKEELLQSVKDIEKNITETISWEESKKKLFSNVYIYEKDEFQHELLSKIISNIQDYNKYSLIKELSNLLKELDYNEV